MENVLQLCNSSAQAVKFHCHRIRQVNLVHILCGALSILFYDGARNADHGTSSRNLFQHHRSGADFHIIANGKRPQHLGAGSDNHPVADGWMAFSRIFSGAAQSHTLVNGHIVTNFSRFTDNHTHTMINEAAAPNHRARMNFNTRHKT